MDAIRLGLQLRALRIRRRWRQVDVALRAGVSRGTISNLERGGLRGVSVETLVRVAAVLGADVDIRIRWHGEQLDRLLDADYASLADAFVAFLKRLGWETALEVTFAIYADRGSIDILAFHAASRTVLVVVIKTVVPDFRNANRGGTTRPRAGSERVRRPRMSRSATMAGISERSNAVTHRTQA
jgi:transcriptional regulator with XRE-family HTH domain